MIEFNSSRLIIQQQCSLKYAVECKMETKRKKSFHESIVK